jgi:hypothetical protein
MHKPCVRLCTRLRVPGILEVSHGVKETVVVMDVDGFAPFL